MERPGLSFQRNSFHRLQLLKSRLAPPDVVLSCRQHATPRRRALQKIRKTRNKTNEQIPTWDNLGRFEEQLDQGKVQNSRRWVNQRLAALLLARSPSLEPARSPSTWPKSDLEDLEQQAESCHLQMDCGSWTFEPFSLFGDQWPTLLKSTWKAFWILAMAYRLDALAKVQTFHAWLLGLTLGTCEGYPVKHCPSCEAWAFDAKNSARGDTQQVKINSWSSTWCWVCCSNRSKSLLESLYLRQANKYDNPSSNKASWWVPQPSSPPKQSCKCCTWKQSHIAVKISV